MAMTLVCMHCACVFDFFMTVSICSFKRKYYITTVSSFPVCTSIHFICVFYSTNVV